MLYTTRLPIFEMDFKILAEQPKAWLAWKNGFKSSTREPKLLPWILLFIFPLGIANLMLPAVIFATRRFSLLDDPDPSNRAEHSRTRKIHSVPTPRLGGLAIVVSFLATLPFLDVPECILKVYLGGVCLFILGFIDDFRPVKAKTKLVMQIAITSATVYSCDLGVREIHLLGGGVQMNVTLGLMFSTALIVGIVNSINMIDGMDGLAAGVALIGIAMLTFQHFFVTKEFWLIRFFALILTGSVLGFLKFNTHPAKIFMGDGGSHWLGFMCGVLSIVVLGGFSPAGDSFGLSDAGPKVPLMSIILCLTVPIADTIALIIYRLRQGKHPFCADHSHFHHSLGAVGLSYRQIVALIYFASFAFAIVAISPLLYPGYKIGFLPPAFFLLSIFGFYRIKNKKLGHSHMQTFIANRSESKKHKPSSAVYLISRSWASLNRYLVYGILFVSSALAKSVSDSLVLVNLTLAGLIAFTGFFKVQKADFFFNSILAISICAILVSTNQTNLSIRLLEREFAFQSIYNSLFVFLLVSSCMYFVVTMNKYRLTITPTDFLLLAIPVLLVIVPEPYNSNYLLDIISARTLILFFAIRTFVVGYSNSMRKIRIVVLFALLNLAFSQ